MECIRDFDGCGSRGKAAYTDAPPSLPRLCGGVMFYDTDYPDAVNLGFHETYRQLVLFFVLPTP